MRNKITKQIWNSVENLLLIYVGSAADFALNSSNHWLFYTNALPSNPQKRFIETLAYNKKLILAEDEVEVEKLAKHIRSIHTRVETSRSKKENTQTQMTNTAFKEVGDMLIDYAIKGYEYLNNATLSDQQKQEYYSDIANFLRSMSINNVEDSYSDFIARRQNSIRNDLSTNEFTKKLYMSYKKDIGPIKYWILKQFQAHFVDPEISKKLDLQKNILFTIAYKIYPHIRNKYIVKILLFIIARKDVRQALLKK